LSDGARRQAVRARRADDKGQVFCLLKAIEERGGDRR